MVADCTCGCVTYSKKKIGTTLQNHRKWRRKAQNKRETFGSLCKSMTYKNLEFCILGFLKNVVKN